MNRKKVLVCGASGFLGYNVFQSLSTREDLEVFGTYWTNRYDRIDVRDSHLQQLNLTDGSDVNRLFSSEHWDTVIQMAANSSGAKDVVERPFVHVTDNVIMNALIFQAAHDYYVPQVIFPSCTVMYPNSDRPLTETDIDLNINFYPKYFGGAWMKVYCEKLCEFYSRLGRTRYTAIRHSNVYGPYDRFDPERSHVCAANINRVMRAPNKSTIEVWGKGTEKRDFLYIDDLLLFVELVLDRQDYDFEVFNVGYGRAVTIKDWIEAIISFSGKDLGVEYNTTKPMIETCISIDSTKALKQFGWQAKTLPVIGLQTTIAWYRKHILEKEG